MRWQDVLVQARLDEAQARQSGDDAALAVALLNRGQALKGSGAAREALEVLLEAVAYVPPEQLEVQARIWHEAAGAQWELACDSEAQEYLALALSLSRQAGDRTLELEVLESLAQGQAEVGDVKAALHSLATCVTVRRDEPGQPGLSRTLVQLAHLQLDVLDATSVGGAADDTGVLGDIQATVEEALASLGAEPPGTRLRLEGWARATLGRVHLHRQEARAACAESGQALALLRQAGEHRLALAALPTQCRALVQLGEANRALADLQVAIDLDQGSARLAERAGLHLAASEACEALGNHRQALDHYRRYHELDLQRRSTQGRERLRAAQARVSLESSRQEAQLHRERSEQLEREVRARTLEVVRSQRAVIELLAGAAEFRDAPLGAHTRWVGEASGELALALGLAPGDAQQLALAARLHDVGKLAIPDAILLKGGPLSDAEWEVMRQHPQLGAQLLTRHGAAGGGPLLEVAAQVALSHHESWDGSGYPRGLRGDDIPLCGRIVRVVDTFDALVTERPYKPAWTEARALAYLAQHAGTLCDPVVVAVFASLHERGALPPRS